MTIKDYEIYTKKAYYILVKTGRNIPSLALYPAQHWWKDNIMFFSEDDEKSFSINEIQEILNYENKGL